MDYIKKSGKNIFSVGTHNILDYLLLLTFLFTAVKFVIELL